jgi:hypothetical protein
MALRNIVAAVALLALGIVYGYLAARLPERDLPNIPGPSFFPVLIAAILVGLSLALLWQGVREWRRTAPRLEMNGIDRKAATMLGVFALYVGAFPYAGFLLASIPFTAALMWLYGGRNKLLLAVVSIGLPIFLFFLFRDVFQILLPEW